MHNLNPLTVIQEMMRAAVAAADPAALVREALAGRQFDPAVAVSVVAVGKAAVAMASAAAELLPPSAQGVVISKLAPDSEAVGTLPPTFSHFQAGHPVPDARSVAATQAVKRLLDDTSASTQVLCLISGGASALLTDPQISLTQWRDLNEALLRCGCSINEINHVRQHVDAVKGGGLLRWAAPSDVETFILSDVIGNDLSHIGSGPTVPTPRDVGKVWRIFEQYKVLGYVSAETRRALERHLNRLGELPRRADSIVHNKIVGDVRRSIEAAAGVAEKEGLGTQIISAEMTGEARTMGRDLAQMLVKMPNNSCYIYGGETTVTIAESGCGIGGRNQELALAAAVALDGHENCWLATLATDGEDGPNAGAGGIVNGGTVATAADMGLDAAQFLARHDSYTFFRRLQQGHVRIGSTGTNVNDVTILLKTA